MEGDKKKVKWTEKYRPKKMKDLVLDAYVSEQINAFIEHSENRHVIFTGVPGTGKTSTAKCIARKILGENDKISYLEMNASEERRIKSVCDSIPKFCKKIVNDMDTKIILLDEADGLTGKCQVDICHMMKTYEKKNVKFIFTCNDSNKIVEGIQSNCRIIRFKKLTTDQVQLRLEHICKKEKVEYDKKGLEMLVLISHGDLRKAINNLQSTAISYQIINKKCVLNNCKSPNPTKILKMLKYCLNKNLEKATEMMDLIMEEGYYYSDILTNLSMIIQQEELDEELRLNILSVVQQTKIDVSTKAKSKLQMIAMICRIIRIVPDVKKK